MKPPDRRTTTPRRGSAARTAKRVNTLAAAEILNAAVGSGSRMTLARLAPFVRPHAERRPPRQQFRWSLDDLVLASALLLPNRQWRTRTARDAIARRARTKGMSGYALVRVGTPNPVPIDWAAIRQPVEREWRAWHAEQRAGR